MVPPPHKRAGLIPQGGEEPMGVESPHSIVAERVSNPFARLHGSPWLPSRFTPSFLSPIGEVRRKTTFLFLIPISNRVKVMRK